MRVLDLFAGLKGWSQAFSDRGHDVRTVENDKRFDDITYYIDICLFMYKWRDMLVRDRDWETLEPCEQV